MKKIVIASLAFMLSAFLSVEIKANPNANIMSDTAGCNEKILNEYDAAADALSVFFKKVKSQISATAWDQFVADFRDDNGTGAFSHCGGSQTEFQNEFISLHNNLVTKIKRLRDNFYQAAGDMTDDQKFLFVKNKIECHVDSMPESRFAPPEIGGGPGGNSCDGDFSRCKRAARRARNSGWWNCTFGGLGLAVVSGGLGLGAGVACHAQNQIDYNNAIEDCEDAYDECLEANN